MNKVLLIFLLIAMMQGQTLAADSAAYKPLNPGLKILKERIIHEVLSAPVNDEELIIIAEKMKDDGSWADINYSDQTRGNWQVSDHLGRLINMAIINKRPGSKWKNDPELQKKILTGLD